MPLSRFQGIHHELLYGNLVKFINYNISSHEHHLEPRGNMNSNAMNLKKYISICTWNYAFYRLYCSDFKPEFEEISSKYNIEIECLDKRQETKGFLAH